MALCIEINKDKKNESLDLVECEGFITIRGFMRKELKLEKTELIVYAIIYGFHLSGCVFCGTKNYLSQWSGSGKTAVKAALASLIKKGLITRTVRRVNNIDYTDYGIVEN
jgi:hypothetical protein